MASPIESAKNLDYLTMWKYFQERGLQTKESMVQVTTWILGFVSAVLAYLVDKTVSVGGTIGFRVDQPATAIGVAASGLALCWFAILVLRDFNEHIDRHFDAADRALKQITSLQPLLGNDPTVDPGPYKGQRLAKRLELVVWMFVAVFALVVISGAVRY